MSAGPLGNGAQTYTSIQVLCYRIIMGSNPGATM